MKEIKLSTTIIKVFSDNSVFIEDIYGATSFAYSANEAQQLLEFLQENLTTTSNEDTIASKIAKDSANEFVREYKKDGDNNWNIS